MVRLLVRTTLMLLGIAVVGAAPLYAGGDTHDTSPQRKVAVNAPTVKALISSMQHHHPYTRAIKEGSVQAGANLDIAQSAFDPFVEQNSFSRVTGYYHGTSLQQRVVKPI